MTHGRSPETSEKCWCEGKTASCNKRSISWWRGKLTGAVVTRKYELPCLVHETQRCFDRVLPKIVRGSVVSLRLRASAATAAIDASASLSPGRRVAIDPKNGPSASEASMGGRLRAP
jgi:hypothetical protein